MKLRVHAGVLTTTAITDANVWLVGWLDERGTQHLHDHYHRGRVRRVELVRCCVLGVVNGVKVSSCVCWDYEYG